MAAPEDNIIIAGDGGPVELGIALRIFRSIDRNEDIKQVEGWESINSSARLAFQTIDSFVDGNMSGQSTSRFYTQEDFNPTDSSNKAKCRGTHLLNTLRSSIKDANETSVVCKNLNNSNQPLAQSVGSVKVSAGGILFCFNKPGIALETDFVELRKEVKLLIIGEAEVSTLPDSWIDQVIGARLLAPRKETSDVTRRSTVLRNIINAYKP